VLVEQVGEHVLGDNDLHRSRRRSRSEEPVDRDDLDIDQMVRETYRPPQ
jgi:hypothetical protein